MAARSKRSHSVIDLTFDDNDWDRNKRSRNTSADHAGAVHNTQSTTERESWADASAEVESSQYVNDDELQSFQQYGTINHKIVGVRFYTGRATRGEFVIIRREPSNPYDRNAIRVDNVMHHQIGHLPRQLAAKLAQFLDDGSIVVEGELTGDKGAFDMPISLRLYGTSDRVAASALKQRMQEARLPTNELARAERERQQRAKAEAKAQQAARKQALKNAASNAALVRRNAAGQQFEPNKNAQFANLTVPGENPASPSDELNMDSIMESTVTFNPREIGEVADKYGSSEETLSKLPRASQPQNIATQLLPFQSQGLAWLLDRENPRLPEPGSAETTQLWKCNRDRSYTHIGTQFTTAQPPALASGGILADDMGLGKTIQILSLIAADSRREGRPTLIVSPLSVMSNWSQQAQAHMRSDCKPKVLIYHGTGRKNQSAEELGEYNIVVTTYQTMTSDHNSIANKKPNAKPPSRGLFSLQWRRVVLDEGHNIRNPKAKMSHAACALSADSRWVLTGTPIVNNLRDLYSHIKFLRLTGGLELNEVFSGMLIRPLNQQRPEAQILLQAIMNTLCLRRMKDMKFVDLKLPALTSHRYAVSFQQEEREKYEAFAMEAKGLLATYQERKNKKGQNVYGSLLEVLLRMRQCCNHWKLCGEERISELLDLASQNQKVELNPENLKRLRDLLQLSIDSQEDCAICLEPLHNPTITACAHAFGGECIERVAETQQKCPMCRNPLQKEDLIQPAEETVDVPAFDTDTSSTKIEALLNILKATRTSSPSTKTVVFSQWTSFLDIIGQQLEQNGFTFCRLDGTMNAAARDSAMQQLESEPKCTIMLASLGVCSVGLNLVAANQAILSDSWWSPAIEDQAVDRIHRLGQTKPVTVFRLVMEDSIEARVLDIQTNKRKLMMTAFGEKTMKRTEKNARMADIQKLLS